MRIRIFIILIFVLLTNILDSFGQSACPSVTVSPSTVSICSGCTTLTATVQGTLATTSYSVSAIPYTPFSYNTGTPILVGEDDIWSNVIDLPFCFDFYGNTYSQVVIGANELITFDLTQANVLCDFVLDDASGTGTPLPGLPNNALARNSIMGPHQDIDPTNMGNIYWQITGTAPCRALVVSYYRIPYFGDTNSVSPGSCPNPLFATSQIVLYEATNIIDIYIEDKPACTGWNSGLAIEGIQNAGGTAAVTVPGRNNTVWTATKDAYRFTPAGAPQYSLTWYEPPNTAIGTGLTVTVCPTASTTYTATVVNNTCSGPITVSSTGTVNVGAGLPPVVSSTPASCSSNSGTATATPASGSPPFTYSWSTAPLQTTQTASGLAAGTYSIIVTDAMGCSAIATVTVAGTGAITSTITSTPSACSANNGTAAVTPSGGTVPYTYQWSPTGGTNATATGLSPGDYTVVVKDANGCTGSYTVTVTGTGAITSTITSTPSACSANNGTAAVTPSGGTVPYTYQWSSTGGTNATATGLSAGDYTVAVTDANGCAESYTVTVTGTGAITSTITSTPSACSANNGTATVILTAGTVPYTYQWTPSGGNNAIATGLGPGNYSVLVSDANGCTATQTVTITQSTAITTTSSAVAASCGIKDGTATVTPSGGTLPYTYLWLTTPSVQTTSTASGLGEGVYSVIITDANGCSLSPPPVTVAGGIPPIADFSFNPEIVNLLDPLITFMDQSTGPIASWNWNFGDSASGVNNSSTQPNPFHIYSDTGIYCTRLIITHPKGVCKDTVVKCLKIESPFTFYIPNSFTPNKDEKNEIFLAYGTYIKEFEMVIFDRWGNKIFESNDLLKGWNGKMQNEGDVALQDVYVWKVYVKDLYNVEYDYIGHVALIR